MYAYNINTSPTRFTYIFKRAFLNTRNTRCMHIYVISIYNTDTTNINPNRHCHTKNHYTHDAKSMDIHEHACKRHITYIAIFGNPASLKTQKNWCRPQTPRFALLLRMPLRVFFSVPASSNLRFLDTRMLVGSSAYRKCWYAF